MPCACERAGKLVVRRWRDARGATVGESGMGGMCMEGVTTVANETLPGVSWCMCPRMPSRGVAPCVARDRRALPRGCTARYVC